MEVKQEVRDIAVQAALSTPTTVYALIAKITVAEWVAICLGLLQALFLIRRWWREETEWGLRMKRLVGVIPKTKPADLDG